jgi:hypothetical protein
LTAPLLNDDGRFLQAVEDFSVEAFVAQLAVERFTVAVLPRTSGFDVERLGAKFCEPATHDLCSHLRTVVRADVFRYASFEHRIGHRLDDPKAVNATSHSDRQAFPGELVNQGHEPELSTIVGLRLNEVVAPDMIAVLRSQPNAGAVVEPQPTSRLLPFGYFKPLTAPDPLDAITANLPAGFGKKRPDPTIAIASIMRSQRDNRSRQRIFISPDDGGVSLRPAWLTDDPAGMTFRKTVLLPNALDCLAAPLGAYKFPKATSLSTCFSNERSATRRFRRTFSRCSSFIRLA